jgi:excisionase family DNA binding protein
MTKGRELSAREAAQRLGVRLDSLYALIWAGKLAAHKSDGLWHVAASAVEERLRAKEAARGTAGR